MPAPIQKARSTQQGHSAQAVVAQAKQRSPLPPAAAPVTKNNLAPPPVRYPQRAPVAQEKSGSSTLPHQLPVRQAAIAQTKRPWPSPPPVHFPQRDIAQARSAAAAPSPARFHQAGVTQKAAVAQAPRAALPPPPVRFPHREPAAQAKHRSWQPLTATVQAKLPNQTCEDDVLAALQGEMHGYCDDQRSCAKANQHCNYYEGRLQINEDCLRLRQQVQDDCFTGHPEAGHDAQIAAVKKVADVCREWIVKKC